MKQITKRIISMLLSLLMIVSMVSVYTFAMTNVIRDEAYYDSFTKTAVIVATEWNVDSNGDVTYSYRNKEYTEPYDEYTHFTSIQKAYDYASEWNIAPVIIVCAGVYSENITLDTDVTILGSNAGIDPNVKSDDKTAPWTQNSDIGNKTVIRGLVELDKFIEEDIAVEFDGVTFSNGFGFIDTGLKSASSMISIYNSLFESIGPFVYKQEAIDTIFYFEQAKSVKATVNIENARVSNMSQASLFGVSVLNINISNMFYANCTMPLMNGVDAIKDMDPVYSIKDSMFYNNVYHEGALVIDHAVNDSTPRNSTEMTISNTMFIEGESNLNDPENATRPFITYNVVGAKNNLNITGCQFVALEDHTVEPINLVFSKNAISGVFHDTIFINNNKFIGFCSVNSTQGLLKDSKIDYSANYFETADGTTSNPVYPASSSYDNVKVDYFWIDEQMTVPSNIFHLNTIGYNDYKIDHVKRTIDLELAQGEKFDLNLVTGDDSVEYKVYSNAACTNEVTAIDSSKLYTGFKKNIFYVVGTSDKCPEYVFAYTMYVTTYNPAYTTEFTAANTYLYAPYAADLKAGTEICKDWDGTAYKFILGKTAYATIEEIFAVADANPTILFAAGTYTQNICLTESATLLGAKHGINPNLPQYDEPEAGWDMNPEREQKDQEATIENAAIFLHSEALNAVVTIDGFTFGEKSAFASLGEKMTSYSTYNIKNIVVSNAGGASYRETMSTGKEEARSATCIFYFGGTSNFENHIKDIRLVNIRMENQGQYKIFGQAASSLLIDGLYYHGNNSNLFSGELTAPKGQNFKLDIRNSSFHENTTGSAQLFLVNNSTTHTEDRKYNIVNVDNNIFYETTQYQYGIFGVRFNSSIDSIYVTNNIFICPDQKYSPMPGDTGWFIGFTGTDKTPDPALQQMVTDAVFRFNRFCGPTWPVDMSNVKEGTVWNYDFNYFAPITSSNYINGVFDKNTAGSPMTDAYSDEEPGQGVCNYYYTDYAMTQLNKADTSSTLSYKINGTGTVDKEALTYTDTVAPATKTYTFDIKMLDTSSTYGIYSDEACTNKLADTVELTAETNVFYIKFTSADGQVSDKYTATITKPLSSKADIVKFSKFSIGENTVDAVLPAEATSLMIEDLVVSAGASYKIYNDAEKKVEFVVTKISNIGDEPVVKYIEVVSEDGTNTKMYTFTITKGISNLCDIIEVENAAKTAATEFTAVVPVDSTSFTFVPTFSDFATLTIYNEGQTYVMTQTEPYVINNIGNGKDITIVVTAQDETTKTFTLKLLKDKSNTEISSIYNMLDRVEDDTITFTTNVNTSKFEVIPTFKNPGSTFKVYSKADLSKVCENNIVLLDRSTVTAYIVVTSEDGTKTQTYTLTINTLNPDYWLTSGWRFVEGYWYFYEYDEILTNSWKKDSIGWCYLGDDGRIVTNSWLLDSQGWCYVGKDGYCITNTWMKDSIGWCYLGAEGRMVTNAWLKDSQGWCYVGEDGYCVTNEWKKDSYGWCYLGEDGRMVKNAWVEDSLGWCYVDKDGYCVTNVWMKDSQGWCYIGAEGRMVTNAWVKDSYGWCYLDENGRMVTDDYVNDSNGKCYLDKDGYWDGKYVD